jgi:hypothetical protein
MPGQFYVADHDLARGPGHAYFTSSMWAVARFDVSNGLGDSANKTCYRYENAMLNTEGRGFLGFKTIVVEEQLQVAAGETASSNPAACGIKNGACSPNNLRTTTEFYQEFPLTGRLKTVKVTNSATNAPLHETIYWWHETQGSYGSKVVYSSATLQKDYETDYETNKAVARQTAQVLETDPISGEPTRICSIFTGPTIPPPNSAPTGPAPLTPAGPVPGAPQPKSRTPDLITLETRSGTTDDHFNDIPDWWLDRIAVREESSDFLTTPFSLNEDCTVTGDGPGLCSSTPPTCPSFSPSPTAKTKKIENHWNPAKGATPGSERMLDHVTSC